MFDAIKKFASTVQHAAQGLYQGIATGVAKEVGTSEESVEALKYCAAQKALNAMTGEPKNFSFPACYRDFRGMQEQMKNAHKLVTPPPPGQDI